MKAVLVGAGRTGGRIALALAQKGWQLKVVDRDCVEEGDLKDSPAFARADVGKMKAGVLAEKVRHRTGSPAEGGSGNVRHYNASLAAGEGSGNVRHYKTEIAFACEHLCGQNTDELLGGAQVVIDATDNWRARALINEWCWRNGVPWAYCGALGTKAMASAIVPPEKPCWLCWNAVEPKEVLSCSAYGIEAAAAQKAAEKAVEQAEAIAAGGRPALLGKLFFADVGKGIEAETKLAGRGDCPVCAKNQFRLLWAREETELVCGGGQWLFLNAGLAEKVRHYNNAEVARKLGGDARIIGEVVAMEKDGAKAIVFPGGRVTVRAKHEPDAAKLNYEIVGRLAK